MSRRRGCRGSAGGAATVAASPGPRRPSRRRLHPSPRRRARIEGAGIASISGPRYTDRIWLAIRRKLMPRSPICDPSGTAKSAVTRISSSCSASRCGRNTTSSLKAKPVRLCSSSAAASAGHDVLGPQDRRERPQVPGHLREDPGIPRSCVLLRVHVGAHPAKDTRWPGRWLNRRDCDTIRFSREASVMQSPPAGLYT